MSCLAIVNLKFLLDWLYLFIQTFKLRNPFLQLLIQMFASLTCQRYDFIPTHESKESENSNGSENSNDSENSHNSENGKIFNNDDEFDTSRKINIKQKNDVDNKVEEKFNISHNSSSNKYKIDDGKFVFFTQTAKMINMYSTLCYNDIFSC